MFLLDLNKRSEEHANTTKGFMKSKTVTLETLGHHPSKHTPSEKNLFTDLCKAFESSELPLAQRLQNFPRHARRQDIARFLAKYEIFQKILGVHGNIIECGVFAGGGLLNWSHFSSILEPFNHTRKIIGFDTFQGFPCLHPKDTKTGSSDHLHEGAFHISSGIVKEIQEIVDLHDKNRPLGHIPRIEICAGDACKTIPAYIQDHPSLLVSLLYLDFDIYAPTKTALEQFFARIVKGGIVAFDVLNCSEFPGETTALLETFDLKSVRLERTQLDPHISFFVK